MMATLPLLVGMLFGGAFAPGEVPPQLLVTRLEQAAEGYRLADALYQNGQNDAENVALWSRRVLEAARPLCKDKETEVAAAQKHLDRMKELEEKAKKRFEAGAANRKDVLAAAYHRTEAEILLAQLKGK
jgi:hypothetical protein